MHVTVDGYGTNMLIMTDEGSLVTFMRQLATVIGMTPVSCYTEQYPCPGTEDRWALSGVCFLKESSIMVHTHPEKGYVFIDIFSCREFDYQKAVSLVKANFDMARASTVVMERGLEGGGSCLPVGILDMLDL